MRKIVSFTIGVFVLLSLVGLAAPAFAFTSGSTGTEDLIVTASQSIPLPPDGVLQYANVHIQSGAELTFTKNEKNTPVTILASGDVTIDGTININGGKGAYIQPGKGGPGGFDGGQGGVVGKVGFRGEGPGGGYGAMGHSTSGHKYSGACGGGGGYVASGSVGSNMIWNGNIKGGAGGSKYGNERLIPLIGGSGGGGGGGSASYTAGGGGGGGGAILIAASGSINITGGIYANGGYGKAGEFNYNTNGNTGGSGGGGAGGAIRLVATTIMGSGTLSADGKKSDKAYDRIYGGEGSAGRIRLEASNNLWAVSTDPPFTFGPAYAVYPPGLPSLRISAINGETIPEIPAGDFNAPDVNLPFTTRNPITVSVAAENVDPSATITLKANPATGSTQTATGALSGTHASSTANIDINISTSYPSVITAYVTVQASVVFNEPFHVDGELVAQVRFSSSLGGANETVYILESGREVSAIL